MKCSYAAFGEQNKTDNDSKCQLVYKSHFELGIMRFGLSILLNKSLLVGTFVGCGNMVLAIRTTLQDVFTVNLADVKLAVVFQFANETRYWGLKGYLHVSLVFRV